MIKGYWDLRAENSAVVAVSALPDAFGRAEYAKKHAPEGPHTFRV